MSSPLTLENFESAGISGVLVYDSISKTEMQVRYLCASSLVFYSIKKNNETVWEGYPLERAIEVYNIYKSNT